MAQRERDYDESNDVQVPEGQRIAKTITKTEKEYVYEDDPNFVVDDEPERDPRRGRR